MEMKKRILRVVIRRLKLSLVGDDDLNMVVYTACFIFHMSW